MKACFVLLASLICFARETTPRIFSDMQPRIIWGTPAVPNSIPHQVIQYAKNQPSCSGSILDQMHVLTAAHCCEGGRITHIVAGEHSLTKTTGREQKVGVVSYTIHEQYDRERILNDVCLLNLEHPLRFNNWVQKVDLPEPGSNVTKGTYCRVSGWGSTETSSISDILLYVDVPIAEDESCFKTWGGNSINRICAGGVAGKAHCSGDSGGPLMCNGVHAGVVSGGNHPGDRPGDIRFYAKTSGFVNWIRDHLHKEQSP